MLALPRASSEEQRNQPSEWEGTQMLRREQHAHRWPSLVRGTVLAKEELWRAENSSLRVRGLRRPEGSGMLIGDPLWWGGAVLARPTRRVTYHRALESGELIPQNERKLRRSEGSGMLIDDPLGEGSKASSTDSKLWRTEHSFPRMRGNSDAHKGAACS